MIRKIIWTGSSLAVTLPKDVVAELKLKAGDEVDVSVHPLSGAIVVRAGVRYVEGGRVTGRFTRASRKILDRYDGAFRELAK